MTSSAVVVGNGDGIGTALFRQFAEAGMDSAICTTRTEDTDHVAEELTEADGSARSIECDPRNPVAIAQGFADILDAFGTLDIVTFVAGPAPRGGLFECTRSEFLDALDRDLLGGFCTTRAVVPKMEASGGGTLLYIGGSTSIDHRGANVGASTAQAGLRGLTTAVDAELDDFDVTHVSIDEIPLESDAGESRPTDEIAALCSGLVVDRDHSRLESAYRIVFDGEGPAIETPESIDG